MENTPTNTTSLSNEAVSGTAVLNAFSVSVATLDNQEVGESIVTSTILQYPVFWDDLDYSWDEASVIWDEATDITSLVNV